MPARTATVAVLLLATAAAAAATVLGKVANPFGWPAVCLGIIATIGAMFAGLANEQVKKYLENNGGQKNELRRARLSGALHERHIGNLDPIADLGVHPALRLSNQPAMPPYIPRTIDPLLDEEIDKGGFIIIEGDSAAGKTRSAYEAITRHASKKGSRKTIVIPRDGVALRQAIESGFKTRGKVIWLDDLERFLSPTGIDDNLIRAMQLEANHKILILATIRSNARDMIFSRAGDQGIGLASQLYGTNRLFAGARVVRIERQLDDDETRAASIVKDDRISAALKGSMRGIGLAEHLAAGPEAVERLKSGFEGANRYGAALVHAAIDIRRAGYITPIPGSWLDAVAPVYLDERFRETITDEERAAGIAWATTPVCGASSCLKLIQDGSYRVFDYLVDQIESQLNSVEDDRRFNTRRLSLNAIPGEVWHLLLDEVDFYHPQFLSCMTASEVAGHPGMIGRFTQAIERGDIDPAIISGGDRLLALSMTCLRLGLCPACTILSLRLDPGPLIAEMYNRLESCLGRTSRGSYTMQQAEALTIAHFLGTDRAVIRPKSPITKAALATKASKAYDLAMLLLDERQVEASRSWFKVAAAKGHSEARARLRELPPAPPEQIGVAYVPSASHSKPPAPEE